MMIKSRSLKCLLVLSVLAITQIATSLPAHATAGCDPTFMETLRQRAWREAQREIMANETFILKPDSVFALSCFGSALSSVPNTFGSGSPTAATNSSLNTYMSGNFNHNTLGGGAGSQSTSNCSLMRTVWQTAKCTNAAAGVFSTFAYNMGTDPRTNNPANCTNNPTATWNSTNTRLNTKVAAQAVGATFDDVNLFLGITDPLAALAGGTNCARGIMTGVQVGTASGTTYNEVVCPNPGCVPVLGSGTNPPIRCCDQTATGSRCSPPVP